jgi:putative spermidine/putrescine transport system substrate-binding protein
MHRKFEEDRLDILASRARRGEISRRRFAQLAAGLVAGTALAGRGRPVLADTGELVFVNWGGDAMDAYEAAFGDPFEDETGIAVKLDGSGPTEGAIQAQFESGQPSWDIVDADPFSAETLGKKGMIRPIDYDIVDRGKMREGFGWEHAASMYFYSYVIAYDARRFGDDPPKDMKDFFDVETYPGRRAMYKWGAGMWEALLMGDGVPADSLYPLDLERAHAKLRDFKEHVISFWGGGAQSQSLMLQGEATMALVWSTRARLLELDTDGDVRFTWNQGVLAPGSMAVLENNPGGGENAMRFIASAQAPERQLVMFDMLAQGPGNPATDALVPEEERRYNPVDPANFGAQVPMDVAWYEENYSAALGEYLKIVSA